MLKAVLQSGCSLCSDRGSSLKSRSLPGRRADFIPRGESCVGALSAGCRHLSVDGPALAGCLSKCHNIEFRNVFTRTEGLVITDCTAHVGFLSVWMFLLCLVLVFLVCCMCGRDAHTSPRSGSRWEGFFLHGLLLPHLYSLLRYKKPCCPHSLILHVITPTYTTGSCCENWPEEWHTQAFKDRQC